MVQIEKMIFDEGFEKGYEKGQEALQEALQKAKSSVRTFFETGGTLENALRIFKGIVSEDDIMNIKQEVNRS